MVGLIDELRELEERASERRGEVNDAMGNAFDAWDTITGATQSRDFTQIINAAEAASGQVGSVIDTADGWIDDAMSDPVDFIQGFLSLGVQTGAQAALDGFVGHLVAPSFFWRYMGGRAPDRTYSIATATATDIRFIRWGVSLEEGVGAHGVSFLASHTGGRSAFISGNADIVILSASYTLDLGSIINNAGFFTLPELTVAQQEKTRAWVGDGGAYSAPETTPPARREVR
jgi:hypothetical protein